VGSVTVMPGLVVPGGACTAAAKSSDVASPLVSVAVTLISTVCALLGAMPLKLSVVALNTSQLGSAVPFCCVAV
jgi:hypothetical protein